MPSCFTCKTYHLKNRNIYSVVPLVDMSRHEFVINRMDNLGSDTMCQQFMFKSTFVIYVLFYNHHCSLCSCCLCKVRKFLLVPHITNLKIPDFVLFYLHAKIKNPMDCTNGL